MKSSSGLWLALPLVAACADVTSQASDAATAGRPDASPSPSAGAAAQGGAGQSGRGSAGSAPAPDAGQPECRGPGRYEAGKEGSYRPCCSDLHEISSGRYDAQRRECVQLPLNIYACVRGECGDGACEIGEADHCGCAADCSDSAPGDGDAGMPVADPAWITITSECGFTLRAPPDLVEFKVQGTDSCVVSYQANGCNYDGDYGFYSGALDSASSQPGYHSQAALIDDQSASVVTYGPLDSAPRWVAGVHFPALPAGASVKFTLLALCDTAAEQSVALQVFDTLRFAR